MFITDSSVIFFLLSIWQGLLMGWTPDQIKELKKNPKPKRCHLPESCSADTRAALWGCVWGCCTGAGSSGWAADEWVLSRQRSWRVHAGRRVCSGAAGPCSGLFCDCMRNRAFNSHTILVLILINWSCWVHPCVAVMLRDIPRVAKAPEIKRSLIPHPCFPLLTHSCIFAQIRLPLMAWNIWDLLSQDVAWVREKRWVRCLSANEYASWN